MSRWFTRDQQKKVCNENLEEMESRVHLIDSEIYKEEEKGDFFLIQDIGFSLLGNYKSPDKIRELEAMYTNAFVYPFIKACLNYANIPNTIFVPGEVTLQAMSTQLNNTNLPDETYKVDGIASNYNNEVMILEASGPFAKDSLWVACNKTIADRYCFSSVDTFKKLKLHFIQVKVIIKLTESRDKKQMYLLGPDSFCEIESVNDVDEQTVPSSAIVKTIILFIGGGDIAEAILVGLQSSGHPSSHLRYSEPFDERRHYMQTKYPDIVGSSSKCETIQGDGVVILAVKPEVLRSVVTTDLSNIIKSKPDLLIVSIVTGITTKDIHKWLNIQDRLASITRCMPNTPAVVGKGVVGLYATDSVNNHQRDMTEDIMKSIAKQVSWVSKESLMLVLVVVRHTPIIHNNSTQPALILAQAFGEIGHGITPIELFHKLSKFFERATCYKGYTNYRRGSPCNHLIVLEQRSLRSTIRVLEGDAVVEHILPGTVVGEMDMIVGSLRHARSLIAKEDCVYWKLTKNTFDRMMKADVGMGIQVLHLISERLNHME